MRSAFLAVNTPACLRRIIDRVQTRLDVLGQVGEFELDITIDDLTLETMSCALMGTDFRRRMRPDLWRLYRDIVEERQFARQILDQRIAEIIAERRASPGTHADVIQTLADARSSGGAWLPIAELQSTIHRLLLAAAEAAPRQASSTLMRLLHQPEFLARLVEEQNAVLGHAASAITLDTLGRLTRLPRAVMEAGPGDGAEDASRSAAHLVITTVLALLLQRYELALLRHTRVGSGTVRYRRR